MLSAASLQDQSSFFNSRTQPRQMQLEEAQWANAILQLQIDQSRYYLSFTIQSRASNCPPLESKYHETMTRRAYKPRFHLSLVFVIMSSCCIAVYMVVVKNVHHGSYHLFLRWLAAPGRTSRALSGSSTTWWPEAL